MSVVKSVLNVNAPEFVLPSSGSNTTTVTPTHALNVKAPEFIPGNTTVTPTHAQAAAAAAAAAATVTVTANGDGSLSKSTHGAGHSPSPVSGDGDHSPTTSPLLSPTTPGLHGLGLDHHDLCEDDAEDIDEISQEIEAALIAAAVEAGSAVKPLPPAHIHPLALKALKRYVEYLFSNQYLWSEKDGVLQQEVQKDAEGHVSVQFLLSHYKKVALLSKEYALHIVHALQDSTRLVASLDQLHIKRIRPFVTFDVAKDYHRTMYVDRLPAGSTLASVKQMFSRFGPVCQIIRADHTLVNCHFPLPASVLEKIKHEQQVAKVMSPSLPPANASAAARRKSTSPTAANGHDVQHHTHTTSTPSPLLTPLRSKSGNTPSLAGIGSPVLTHSASSPTHHHSSLHVHDDQHISAAFIQFDKSFSCKRAISQIVAWNKTLKALTPKHSPKPSPTTRKDSVNGLTSLAELSNTTRKASTATATATATPSSPSISPPATTTTISSAVSASSSSSGNSTATPLSPTTSSSVFSQMSQVPLSPQRKQTVPKSPMTNTPASSVAAPLPFHPSTPASIPGNAAGIFATNAFSGTVLSAMTPTQESNHKDTSIPLDFHLGASATHDANTSATSTPSLTGKKETENMVLNDSFIGLFVMPKLAYFKQLKVGPRNSPRLLSTMSNSNLVSPMTSPTLQASNSMTNGSSSSASSRASISSVSANALGLPPAHDAPAQASSRSLRQQGESSNTIHTVASKGVLSAALSSAVSAQTTSTTPNTASASVTSNTNVPQSSSTAPSSSLEMMQQINRKSVLSSSAAPFFPSYLSQPANSTSSTNGVNISPPALELDQDGSDGEGDKKKKKEKKKEKKEKGIAKALADATSPDPTRSRSSLSTDASASDPNRPRFSLIKRTNASTNTAVLSVFALGPLDPLSKGFDVNRAKGRLAALGRPVPSA